MNIENITSEKMDLSFNGKVMQIKVYEDLIQEKDKEIERLNNKIKEQNLLLIEFQDMEQKLKLKDNIINKLEDYTKANIEVCENRLSSPFCNFEKATKELSIFQNYLDKLNKLKENNNE